MKKLITLVISFLLVSACLMAQTGFSYQAVLRDSDGTIRDNETVNLVVELIQNDVSVYSETHSVVTNAFGAFTIVVGQGASGQTYSPSLFLNSDSTALNESVLKVTEAGGKVLSESAVLGVPIAEVAKVALTAHVEFPAGAIIPFGGPSEKVPVGWLLCDGMEYGIADYPELYEVIGASWGSSAAETFRVPDLRGVSLRGVNGTADDAFTDPNRTTRIARYTGGAVGDTVGSYQHDAMQNVTGTVGDFNTYAAIHGNSTGPFKQTWVYGGTGIGSGSSDNYNRVDFDLSRSARTSAETRPKNANVNFIIKY
ncbi:MAG: tail fiber protein [Bacteroidales bacterium]|nr:tail fiber protein [Bacteroidales bacterium]MBN2698391.1 tail fiber protein [Bacteroidales bacterium]